MFVTAVVLPHPPLLVPSVASGAATELDDLRASCLDALRNVERARLDGCDVVVVGGGPERATYVPGSTGSLAGFGVPLDVTLPGDVQRGSAVGRMSLSLSVGAWLMAELDGWTGYGGTVRAEAVPFDLPAADAVALGRQWADVTDRLALVVMGDGSRSLSTKAPGYLVPGAEEWQSVTTAALGGADTAALSALSADDAVRFGADGRAAWQVLAGAASEASVQGKLLAADDRYGVAYVVALWSATEVAA